MTIPNIVGSSVAYQGRVITVRIDDLVESKERKYKREVAVVPDSVAVVVLDEQGRVLLIRQYRHPMKEFMWEIPAGRLDVQGEPSLDAALRELAEEVDLKASSAEELATFGNSIGWTTEMTTVYLVREFAKTDTFARRNEEASIEARWLPLAEAIEEIGSHEIRDAKTIIGLLLTSSRVG